MIAGRPQRGNLFTAEKAGIAAISLAALLAPVDPRWAIFPLGLFLLLCAFLPFLPCSNFFLPVICRGHSGQRGVALTFDDGPDPRTTPALLDLLAARRVHATFFVTGRKARAHPELIRRIIKEGHDIGNHSFGHDTLVMFKGKKRIKEEIGAAQAVLESLGVSPRAFRPPAGITYPGLGPALDRCGLVAVNYSRRALDRGNRRIDGLAAKILTPLVPGDIIMLHDIAPPDPARLAPWLDEIETLLAGIDSRRIRIRPLAEITKQPVWRPMDRGPMPEA